MGKKTIAFHAKYINLGHLRMIPFGPVIFSKNGFAMSVGYYLKTIPVFLNLLIGMDDIVSCLYHYRYDLDTSSFVKVLWLEITAEFATEQKHNLCKETNFLLKYKTFNFDFDPKGIYSEETKKNFIVICFDNDKKFDLNTLDEFKERFSKFMEDEAGSSEDTLFSLTKEEISPMLQALRDKTIYMNNIMQNSKLDPRAEEPPPGCSADEAEQAGTSLVENPSSSNIKVESSQSAASGWHIPQNDAKAQCTPEGEIGDNSINAKGNTSTQRTNNIDPHDLQRNASLPILDNQNADSNNISLAIQNIQHNQIMTNFPIFPFYPIDFTLPIMGTGLPVFHGQVTSSSGAVMPPGPLPPVNPVQNSGDNFNSGFPKVFLKADCLAVGAYKKVPIREVEISTESIKLWFDQRYNLSRKPELQGCIHIPTNEVMKVLACFSDSSEAALFIYTSPVFAAQLWELWQRHFTFPAFKDENDVINSMNLIVVKLSKVKDDRAAITNQIFTRMGAASDVGPLFNFIDQHKASQYATACNFYSKGSR